MVSSEVTHFQQNTYLVVLNSVSDQIWCRRKFLVSVPRTDLHSIFPEDTTMYVMDIVMM